MLWNISTILPKDFTVLLMKYLNKIISFGEKNRCSFSLTSGKISNNHFLRINNVEHRIKCKKKTHVSLPYSSWGPF